MIPSQWALICAYAGVECVTCCTDRELYLPAAWTEDRTRCRPAGIADDRIVVRVRVMNKLHTTTV